MYNSVGQRPDIEAPPMYNICSWGINDTDLVALVVKK